MIRLLDIFYILLFIFMFWYAEVYKDIVTNEFIIQSNNLHTNLTQTMKEIIGD